VGQDTYDHIEAKVRETARNIVDTIPSKGKTIQIHTNRRKKT
jgi:hypothetical protein